VESRRRGAALGVILAGIFAASLCACGSSGVQGTVTVTDRQGKHPFAGAVVAVFRGDLLVVHPAGPQELVAKATTDESGHFAVDLEPGTYTLTVVDAAGANSQSKTVEVRKGGHTDVQFGFASP
jgi:hypothetical protein